MVALVKNTITLAMTTSLSLFIGVGTVLASDAETQKETSSVPMTITLTDVIASDVPLYISVQTEENYRSMKGHGTILKQTTAGTVTETVQLPAAGDYAISIWHDLDNDGRFSMNERYEILDGWGTSGGIPEAAAPSFSTSKISVPSSGAETTIAMIYPQS